jgi:SNF family Na+-dependent transporter
MSSFISLFLCLSLYFVLSSFLFYYLIALHSTKYGHKVNKAAKPYVNYVGELAKPVYYSSGIMIGATKATVRAGVNGGTGKREER